MFKVPCLWISKEYVGLTAVLTPGLEAGLLAWAGNRWDWLDAAASFCAALRFSHCSGGAFRPSAADSACVSKSLS